MYTRRVARGAKAHNLIMRHQKQRSYVKKKRFDVYDFRNGIDAEGTE